MVTSRRAADELEQQVEQAITNALRGKGVFAVLGNGSRAEALLLRQPDLFCSREVASDATGVLALDIEQAALLEARDVARALGTSSAFFLVESGETGLPLDVAAIRARVRGAGFALVALERLLWREAEVGSPPGATRRERIDVETRLALARCVLADDPGALEEFEDEIARLQEELDLYRQLGVDHARAREAERVRAQRLRELEALFERLGGTDLAAEVERLRTELEAMRATRVWRLGARWWGLKARLRRRSE